MAGFKRKVYPSSKGSLGQHLVGLGFAWVTRGQVERTFRGDDVHVVEQGLVMGEMLWREGFWLCQVSRDAGLTK